MTDPLLEPTGVGESSLSELLTSFQPQTRCFLEAYTAQSPALPCLHCARMWLRWSDHSKLEALPARPPRREAELEGQAVPPRSSG